MFSACKTVRSVPFSAFPYAIEKKLRTLSISASKKWHLILSSIVIWCCHLILSAVSLCHLMWSSSVVLPSDFICLCHLMFSLDSVIWFSRLIFYLILSSEVLILHQQIFFLTSSDIVNWLMPYVLIWCSHPMSVDIVIWFCHLIVFFMSSEVFLLWSNVVYHLIQCYSFHGGGGGG
jgi:hypothetical protein